MKTITDYTKLEKDDGIHWLMGNAVLQHGEYTYKVLTGFQKCKQYLKDRKIIVRPDEHQALFITNDPQFKHLHAIYSSSKLYFEIDKNVAAFTPAFNRTIFQNNP